MTEAQNRAFNKLAEMGGWHSAYDLGETMATLNALVKMGCAEKKIPPLGSIFSPRTTVLYRAINRAIIVQQIISIPFAHHVLDVSQYGGLGCDLIVLFARKVIFVETRASAMTQSNLGLREMCENTGNIHVIARSVEDVLRAMGIGATSTAEEESVDGCAARDGDRGL